MVLIIILLGLVTLAVGVCAAFGLRILPTLRLQLVALAFLAVVLPLGAVLASGLVMFHMHDDFKILALSSASALAAIVGALLLARWLLAPHIAPTGTSISPMVSCSVLVSGELMCSRYGSSSRTWSMYMDPTR